MSWRKRCWCTKHGEWEIGILSQKRMLVTGMWQWNVQGRTISCEADSYESGLELVSKE